MKGKLNIPMVVFSAVGGAAGWLVGELLLGELLLPRPVTLGLYFGIIAVLVCSMCLLAETLFPVINGYTWRNNYSKTAWKFVVPISLAALFVGGALLQLVYQLDFNGVRAADDIILVIDKSDSMRTTDPDNQTLSAAQDLVQQMTDKNRVSVVSFNGAADVDQPMIKIDSQTAKDEVIYKIGAITQFNGTDIANALDTAYNHYVETKDRARGARVILLSDGYSEINVDRAVKPFVDENIAVNTVGVLQSDLEGNSILREIAAKTGGKFFDVTDASQIKSVFTTIYEEADERNLVNERTGTVARNGVYALLRVLFVTVLSVLISLVLGIIFDNRDLALPLMIGGLFGGVAGGVLLELLLPSFVSSALVRLAAVLCISVVFTLFTIFAKSKEYISNGMGLGSFNGRGGADKNSSFSGKTFDSDDKTKKRF